MASSSVFIDLSPSLPQALVGACCVGGDEKLRASLQQLAAKEDWAGFIVGLVSPCMTLLRSDQTATDPEMAFSLLFSLLRRYAGTWWRQNNWKRINLSLT